MNTEKINNNMNFTKYENKKRKYKGEKRKKYRVYFDKKEIECS